MPRSLPVRRAFPTFIVVGCALAAGCLSNDPGRKTDTTKPGETRAKPPAQFADHDPNADRIVVRPQLQTVPVGEGQVFIATVYDADGKPRRRRKVEWMVEGPGSIVEVDDGGYLPGKGIRSATQFAFSQTAADERHLIRGKDEFTVRPGQTWCIVKSAVEGETTVIGHCPAIDRTDRCRATATLYWSDKNMRYPAPATAKAGGEYSLNTSIGPPGEGYRVRYRILDGPAAALTTGRGGEVDSVTEAIAPIGDDGTGRVNITQPLPAAGTNRIGIEVVKPDPTHPGQVTVVSRGETRVTWQAVRLDVSVSASKFLALNQDATVSYTVGSSGPTESGNVTLTAKLPPEVVLIGTEPKATVDEDTLIWTLPSLSAGRPETVKAIVRPTKLGPATLTAEARTEDGITGRSSCPVSIAEARLLLKLDGPTAGLVGESLPFRVTVTNAGDGPADHVSIHGKLDDGLETANRAATVDETILTLGAGQSKTVSLPLTARQSGKFGLRLSASAERGLVAAPQTATIEVKDAQLALSVHGPACGYVGQQTVWALVVRNTGDVPMTNVALKATLPPEVALVKATNGGKASGKQVAWDLQGLAAREERTIAVTAVCNKVVGRATLSATVTGTPVGDLGAKTSPGKPVVAPKPVETAIEIVGVPALQISVKGPAERARVGQRIAYTVRVTNAGTLPAQKVEVAAHIPGAMVTGKPGEAPHEEPKELRPVRGTGPGAAAAVTGQRVVFPALESLAPNAETSFVIEVVGEIPGEARLNVEVRSASQTQPLRATEPVKVIAAESPAPEH